jgi:hypothetical protein
MAGRNQLAEKAGHNAIVELIKTHGSQRESSSTIVHPN